MDTRRIDEIFARTLDDGRLTRSERDALVKVLEGIEPSESQLAQFRSRAFEAAMERAGDKATRDLLGWLEEVVKVSARPFGPQPPQVAEAWFSPGTECLSCIQRLLGEARASVDICVFTITDDRISDAIVRAHDRGVAVRILTDDDKAFDRGSDVRSLAREGLSVAVDGTPHHMHHKFAIFDERLLLTGSYNWTRSAATVNEENVLVTDDGRLVSAFCGQFEAMWEQMA